MNDLVTFGTFDGPAVVTFGTFDGPAVVTFGTFGEMSVEFLGTNFAYEAENVPNVIQVGGTERKKILSLSAHVASDVRDVRCSFAKRREGGMKSLERGAQGTVWPLFLATFPVFAWNGPRAMHGWRG